MEHLNIEKLIEIVGFLIKKYENKINYTKLIKEIYLADRLALLETGYSISGDNYCSMHCGPVLSALYDLIMQKCPNHSYQTLWNTRFTRDNYDLHLVCSFISENELSTYEIEILEKIDNEFHDKDYRYLIEYTHTHCPEWIDTDSSIPIEQNELLRKLGFSDQQIKENCEDKSFFSEEKTLIDSLPDSLPENYQKFGVRCCG